ncbi:MAG: CotH kinase family protein [Candidatus Marinimicrobia bacterium]|nr:CotH kinase family protein [Candidatus Neomarinimicrobiota bacterium]
MFLKKQQFKGLLSVVKSSQFKREVWVGLIILATLLFGALVYRYLARSDILHDIVKPTLRVGRQVPIRYVKGLLSDPEKISIDIKFENYQKILQKRNEALEKLLLFSSDDDYVSATIRYNDKEIPIEMRLKGDAIDHLDGDKWSFRIKIKGDETLFGMQRFSIQDPKRRNYIDEWIFHELLKKEELPFLRYKFIDVTINGKHLGTYAVEEHITSNLLANNRLPEGPVLKFDESLFFDLVLRSGSHRAHVSDPRDEIYISNPIDVFGSSKLDNPVFYDQFQSAKNLLEGFRTGALTASQVFDVEKLAKFYAIADLINAVHATGWTNTRLYYNPITSLLEPVGYDAFTNVEGPITRLMGYPIMEEWEKTNSIYHYKHDLFKDMAFFEEYVKQLNKMSQPDYIEEFFDEIDKELNNNLHIIWRDNPLYSFLRSSSNCAMDVIYQNQKYIRNALNPVVGIRAYLKETTPKVIVEVANIQPLPVVFQEELLPGRAPNTPLVFQEFELEELPEKLDYKILGVVTVQKADIIPWSALDMGEVDQILSKRTANYYLFNFLLVDYTEKTITVKPGRWNLTRDLIIPADFTFIAGPWSEVDITNSARIISYSPLKFIGSGDYPVRVVSSDKTSKGIWVYATEKSYLESVVISNNLVNFYESPSFISKVYFSGSSSYDDTLHITRSDFELVDSVFNDTFADALDVDYGSGTILRTLFGNSGNDAIDFSGSVVTVKDSQIKNTGDKGVSVGEDSYISVDNLTISDSNLGLVSKDLSVLDATNVTIENCEVGVAVFQKKPEFGPARATISNLQIVTTTQNFLVEEGSFLEVNGDVIKDEEIDLKDRLYVE